MDSILFGPYRPVGALSGSGSATVYRAHDTAPDDRDVALTVVWTEGDLATIVWTVACA